MSTQHIYMHTNWSFSEFILPVIGLLNIWSYTMAYATSKCLDQHAHPDSLVKAIAVSIHELDILEKQLVSYAALFFFHAWPHLEKLNFSHICECSRSISSWCISIFHETFSCYLHNGVWLLALKHNTFLIHTILCSLYTNRRN